MVVNPHVIHGDHMQRLKKLRFNAAASALFAGLFFAPMAAEAQIYGSVLPISRAVAVNATATAFATIINAGSTNATNCRLTMPGSVQGVFNYQTTNPTTNVPTGK